MSRHIELLLSRKETFPIKPMFPGLHKSEEGIGGARRPSPCRGEGVRCKGGIVCVCVYVVVCAHRWVACACRSGCSN